MADIVITTPPPNTLTITPATTPAASASTVVVDSSRGGSKGDKGDQGDAAPLAYARDGELTVATGVKRYRFPYDCVILGISATLGTAPMGDDVIVDILVNGDSLFPTPGDRIVVPDGSDEFPEDPRLPEIPVYEGNFLTMNVEQVGSTIRGADLLVLVRYRRA